MITLRCQNKNDRFTVVDGTLLYPVGLVTAQDVALAGGYLSVDEDHYNGGVNGTVNNESYYMYSYGNSWTMSPLSKDGKMIYIDAYGTMRGADANEEYSIISSNSDEK